MFIFAIYAYNFTKIRGKVVIRIIDYSPLWETMRIKEVSQYQLLKKGIDNRLLSNLKNNRNITLLTLEKLCTILDCTPNDIIRFIPENKS